MSTIIITGTKRKTLDMSHKLAIDQRVNQVNRKLTKKERKAIKYQYKTAERLDLLQKLQINPLTQRVKAAIYGQ